MDIKGDSGEGSEGRERSCRESFSCPREYLHYQEQNVARNVNIEGASGKVLEMRDKLLGPGGKMILVKSGRERF